MTFKVEIRRADPSAKPVLFNLLQIYLHHFASLSRPDDPAWRFNQFGQLDFPEFNSYWADRKRHPYLIYANSELAGFALINDGSASGRPVDFFVGEFFIAGKYSGQGIGRQAARSIFRHHPGIWELGVVAGNEPAIPFWQKTLESPGIRDLQVFPGDGERWNGTIFRFSV